jgi:glycosyltransferase involved in cell wall biosynthesis
MDKGQDTRKILEGGLLIHFHMPSKVGYAIGPQEHLFSRVGLEITASSSDVHVAYVDLSRGMPDTLPKECMNIIELNLENQEKSKIEEICDYVRQHNIKTFLGYDAPVKSRYYKYLRKAGIKRIVSHWGAPLSSINSGIKLFMKRLEILAYSGGPDLFILQSEGMKQTAVNGRGIQESRTLVINTGVDTELNTPNHAREGFLQSEFGIPIERKVVFYSGHFEERKGVRVIIRAAMELINNRSDLGWHFLLFGNAGGEERIFQDMLAGTEAEKHVTFGGYRKDLNLIRPNCYLGTVATTGWDSFPRSTLEMQASGLPLFVSDLPGLRETVEPGVSGMRFEVGNHIQLADLYQRFGQDLELRNRMSEGARKRILDQYSLSRQKKDLIRSLMYY